MFCICGLHRLKKCSHFLLMLESLQDAKYISVKKWQAIPDGWAFSAKHTSPKVSYTTTTLTHVEDDQLEHKNGRKFPSPLCRIQTHEVVSMFHPKSSVEATTEYDAIGSDTTASEKKKIELGTKKPKSKPRRMSTPKYPLLCMGDDHQTFTVNYEKSLKFLQSLNLPTNSLSHYPDVQNMSEEDICLCLERLQEVGIHVVFSLFLIQRIFEEIELEKSAQREPLEDPKFWFKLRNGKYRVSSMQAVLLYLELCTLLENPKLDLCAFLDSLAAVKIYDPLTIVVSKTRQLCSLGATSQDILSNLPLLKGNNLFKAKIKLYKNLFRKNKPPFPVYLFLSATMTEFIDKLQVGTDISFISNLLEINPVDFLMCWGFKNISTSSLVYKIHLCLRAGISKQGVFNNINMLNRLPLKKTQLIMESLFNSGQSVSLYELKALADDFDLKKYTHVREYEKDWTHEEKTGTEGDVSHSNLTKIPEKIKKKATKVKNKTTKKSYQSVETSKIWRIQVFGLITHLLQLSTKARQAMYKANISVDSIQIQDIIQNFDHLSLGLKFTRDQISACPLILAHPHRKLCFTTLEVESMLDQHYTWAATPTVLPDQNAESHIGTHLSSSSPLPTSSTSLLLSASQRKARLLSSSSSSPSLSFTPEKHWLSDCAQATSGYRRSIFKKVSVAESRIYRHSPHAFLLTDPITHLNILQYFLEKETGFSLTSSDTFSISN